MSYDYSYPPDDQPPQSPRARYYSDLDEPGDSEADEEN